MTEENRNLIMAVGLSMLVMFGWYYFIDRPRAEAEQQRLQATAQQAPASMTQAPAPMTVAPAAPDVNGVPQPDAVPAAPAIDPGAQILSRAAMLASTPRIQIDNGQVHGSISLQGGRLGRSYACHLSRNGVGRQCGNCSAVPGGNARTLLRGIWFCAADGSKIPLPDHRTVWSADMNQVLRADQTVTMQWDNGAGLKFTRTYALDEHYLFTITEQVENSGAAPVSLMPYGLVSRHYTPEVAGYFILHEGLLGVLGGTLNEITYEDIRDAPSAKIQGAGGWLGITDKYWLVSLIPDQAAEFAGSFSYNPIGARDRYQADYLRAAVTIAPGQRTEITSRLFAGAKKVSLIDAYTDKYSITLFDRAIDWGWFYFLTKPLFVVIDWFFTLTGILASPSFC